MQSNTPTQEDTRSPEQVALEAQMQTLIDQRDEIVTQLKAVTRKRDAIVEAQLAAKTVSEMSDARKTAILQAMGIESTSSVGTGTASTNTVVKGS